jgi:hypothetical protein
MQNRTQVPQGTSEPVEFQPLARGDSLPEALKRLGHIGLFALQATCCLSLGMTMQPASRHPANAVFHPRERLSAPSLPGEV